jgi:bacillithiol biosynthesis deacetylase BshB1
MNLQPLDLLVFAAHPDDAEIGMGGTIIKHAKAGYRVGVCDLTEAELSSNGTPATRRIEAQSASTHLQISQRIHLSLPDRGLRPNDEQIRAIVEIIRTTKPRIVFAPYWIDRHPDHVACSKLVEEAVFNAKLRRYAPELPAHAPDTIYFYFIHEWPQAADLIVDISSVYEQKSAALQCYQSQFLRIDGEDIISTPLNQGYLEQVEARDRLLGSRHGVRYAEGFVQKGPQMVERLL